MDGIRRQPVAEARTTLWWLMRAVWGLLATVHVWPLAAVGWRFVVDPSVDEALVLASLIGVFALFACKCLDARWLRFHRPGLEFTAFVVAAALVHGDVGRSHTLPVLAAETVSVAVVVGGAAAVTSRRLRRRLGDLLRGLARSARGVSGAMRPIGVIGLASWRRPEWRMGRAESARGPPSLAW
ncbi:MAG: hypothetical protein IT431_02580 [Phycisphaerales bacterium]|nr:hypothetical protein [Phycisphaerales bacterium]